jgi:hypothetical protein
VLQRRSTPGVMKRLTGGVESVRLELEEPADTIISIG